MTKEKYITLTHNISKAALIKLRKTTTVEKGVDWVLEKDSNNHRGAVLWTKEGLKKLYTHFGIEDKPVDIKPPPPLKEEEVQKPEIKTNSQVPGIVRRKFPNKRLVLCEIRGVNSLVVVRDSTNMRVGNILSVISRGNQLIGT